MTLVTEALLLWVLINHLRLPLIAQIICVVLFFIGPDGFVNVDYGNGRVFKL